MWNPFALDSVRLFTPISSLGVFYIIYSSMRTITTVGGQYAVKVSYSKDKVFFHWSRNFSSSKELITTECLKKTFMKQLIFRFFLQDKELELKISVLKIVMDYGEFNVWTVTETFFFTMMIVTGIANWRLISWIVYFFVNEET